MTTNTSAAQLMDFAAEGMLDKAALAQLLPPEPREAFLAACAQIERDFTRACAAHGEFCLASGCALEGESCLNALLNAAPAYNKACGQIWLPLFRSSRPVV
jgi:hypothetical protein